MAPTATVTSILNTANGIEDEHCGLKTRSEDRVLVDTISEELNALEAH